MTAGNGRSRSHAISSERISSRATPRSPIPPSAFLASGTSGSVPEEVDVLIVGCGPAGLTLAAQLVGVSRHQDLHRRAEAGPAAARPGRRHRLPHDGDVRGLRLQRARAEGGLLDQRDDVLEAGRRAAARTSSAAAGCRTSKTGCRNSRTSSSIRRACMISISTSCANRRRSSSRTIRGACSTLQIAAGGARSTTTR